MIGREHELHRRRRGRNAVLGVLLGGIVLLIFAATLAKLSEGGMIRGFDHTPETVVVR
jgi:hypothetical protein